MRYRVELKPVVERQVARLPKYANAAFGRLVERLQCNPRYRGVRPIATMPGVLRARFGDYRALFVVDDVERLVTVIRVAPRGRAYRT